MGHHTTTGLPAGSLKAALIAAASLGLAGCNTASGFGDDMSSGWHWITGTSSSSSSAAPSSSTPSGTQTASTGTSTPPASQPHAQKPHAVSGSTDPSGMTRTQIRQAQTKLHDGGYYSGPIDGIIGPQTRSAVMAFQNKEGISPNGELDTATMSSLNGKM